MNKKNVFVIFILMMCMNVSPWANAQEEKQELTAEELEIIEMLDFLENMDVLEESIDLLESLDDLNLMDKKEERIEKD